MNHISIKLLNIQIVKVDFLHYIKTEFFHNCTWAMAIPQNISINQFLMLNFFSYSPKIKGVIHTERILASTASKNHSLKQSEIIKSNIKILKLVIS